MFNRSESKFGASTCERIDDSADVIADQTETGGAAVLFDCATKGSLGVTGETVGFIQNDQFEGRARIITKRELE